MNRSLTALVGALAGVALTLSVAAVCVPEDEITTPAPPAPPTHSRPADGARATGPVSAYDTGVLFCGTDAGVATDVDPHGNAWAYCEPALAGQ